MNVETKKPNKKPNSLDNPFDNVNLFGNGRDLNRVILTTRRLLVRVMILLEKNTDGHSMQMCGSIHVCCHIRHFVFLLQKICHLFKRLDCNRNTCRFMLGIIRKSKHTIATTHGTHNTTTYILCHFIDYQKEKR